MPPITLFLLGFPGLIMVALTLVYLRYRHDALTWAVTAVGSLLYWAVLLFFSPTTPFPLSQWMFWFPRHWVTTWNLLGQWGPLPWSMALILATWNTVALLSLSSLGNVRYPPWHLWLFWWVAVLLGVWLILPATPAALWWAWTLGDGITLLLALRLTREESRRFTWIWHITARAPTWLVALAWSASAGYASLESPQAAPTALIPWLYLAGLWRIWWAGSGRGVDVGPPWVRHVALFWLTWLGLSSTVILFPALARMPQPRGLWFPLLMLLALGTMVLGLVRWLAAERPEAGLPGWLNLAAGMMTMAALHASKDAARFWTGWPWLIVAMLAFFPKTEPGVRLLSLPILAAMSFLPYTPGHAALAWTHTMAWPWRLGVLFLLAVGMLSSFPLHWWQRKADFLQPRWARGAYLLSMGVLALGLWRWGFPWVLQQPTRPWAWMAGPSMWLLSALLALWLWYRRHTLEWRFRAWQATLRFLTGPVIALYRAGIRYVEDGLFFLSLIFEGPSSLMWALAFLMALVLFLFRQGGLPAYHGP